MCGVDGGTYGHDEGVAQAGCAVRNLVAKLDVVVVEPAPGDDGDPVKPSDARLREQAGEHVADDAADSMGGEDLSKEKFRSVSTTHAHTQRK